MKLTKRILVFDHTAYVHFETNRAVVCDSGVVVFLNFTGAATVAEAKRLLRVSRERRKASKFPPRLELDYGELA